MFVDPDVLDIARNPNPHVAFGHGPHTCIGAPLARMELAVVLQRFLGLVTTCHVIAPTDWRPRAVDEITTGAAFPDDLVLAVG